MPQLKSGRHVGFSHDRLMAWANAQTDNGQWLRFVITGVEPADLWRNMEVVYYRAAEDAPSPDQPELGQPYRAGFTVGEMESERSDLTEDERAELQSFFQTPRLQAWMKQLFADVMQVLKSKPPVDGLQELFE